MRNAITRKSLWVSAAFVLDKLKSSYKKLLMGERYGKLTRN